MIVVVRDETCPPVAYHQPTTCRMKTSSLPNGQDERPVNSGDSLAPDRSARLPGYACSTHWLRQAVLELLRAGPVAVGADRFTLERCLALDS